MKTKTITLSVVKDKRYIHEAIRNGALEQNKKASSLANKSFDYCKNLQPQTNAIKEVA